MKDIEKKVEDLNEELNKITKTQREMIDGIKKYKERKDEIREEFYKENSNGCEEIIELCKEIKECLGSDESLDNIWESFSNLYYKAFHGITHGRVETKIKLTDKVKVHYWLDNLWLNSRGLAYKPNDRYWWGWSENKDATKMIGEFWKVVYITKKHPEIEDYIKKDDKKEIFKAFYKCCKSWKVIDIKDEKMDVDIYSLKNDHNYDVGIHDIYTKKYNTLEINFDMDRFTLHLGNDSYSGTNIYLSEDLDEKGLFLLSQMSEEVIGLVKKHLANLKKVYDNNKKAYGKFKERGITLHFT